MNCKTTFPIVFALEERGDLVRLCRSFRATLAFLTEPEMVQTNNLVASGQIVSGNPRFEGIGSDPNLYEFRCRIYEAFQWMKLADIEGFVSFARVAAYQECRLRSARFGTCRSNLRFVEFMFEHWRIDLGSGGSDDSRSS